MKRRREGHFIYIYIYIYTFNNYISKKRGSAES